MNHFHLQLITRYSYEKEEKNSVKQRFEYVEDKAKIDETKKQIINYNIKCGNIIINHIKK